MDPQQQTTDELTTHRIAKKRDDWLAAAGVDELHRRIRIDASQLPPEVRSWIDGMPESLRIPGGFLLAGRPGTGKTIAAVAALSQVFRRYWIDDQGNDLEPPRPEGLFVRATDLMDEIEAGGLARSELMRTARRVQVLVVDDWRQQMPGWIADRLDDLIDRRYTALRPTFVTTNIYAGDELDEETANFKRLFPRAASRLIDVRGGGLVIANGDDRRLNS